MNTRILFLLVCTLLVGGCASDKPDSSSAQHINFDKDGKVAHWSYSK